MSEQHVTEAEKPCIAEASKPKSYGQIGYEAMLAVMRERDEKAGRPWTDDPELWALTGDWESQPAILRDDWDAIGHAIVKEFSARFLAQCERDKAVQP